MRMILEPSDNLIGKCRENSWLSDYLEALIVITLSIASAVIFFDAPRWTRVFGEVGLGVLLLWILFRKQEAAHPLPKFLIIATIMYILSYVVNVFMCPDPTWEHVNIRKYIYVMISGLLFAYPLKGKYRRFMIIVFFSSAAIAGFEGIIQFLKWGTSNPAQGFSDHHIHYAQVIAFACGAAVIILFIREKLLFGSKSGILFLSLVAILTFAGILFSQARGEWIALVIACVTTLFLYDRRKTFVLSLVLLIIFSIVFPLSTVLRKRAISIVTSIYTENEIGSTTARFELWKGSWLIFKDHPILGIGTGNFESEITRLIAQKRIKNLDFKMQAHNIFLQALATRGIIGLVTSIGFLGALMTWGLSMIRDQRGIGGYIIVLSTILTIVGGLTENNIEFTKFLAAFSFTVGLIGPYSACQAEILKIPAIMLDSSHQN